MNTHDPTPDSETPIVKKTSRFRRPLKAFGWFVVFILLVPFLLYIPPVQDFLVKTATGIVKDKTGFDVGIEQLRLKFPVNLALQGVSVVEASGDTMLLAREAVADVRMLPLLSLDMQINRLRLKDAFYRMLSADSSMLLTLRAGLLEVDDKSNANFDSSKISLNEAYIRDADIHVGMDVWKQTPTPEDTTATPFVISLAKLNVENINFTMSMLPTIDTLSFNAPSLSIEKGLIDLRTNEMSFGCLKSSGGNALMLAPSAEYVSAHPAPLPDTTSTTKPMTITADKISLSRFGARYAVADAPKIAGFDTNDIRVSGLSIDIDSFFNRASEIRLPITSVQAMEQCGLILTEGSGVFSMDSTGMALNDFKLKTPFSSVDASADIPNTLMTLQPDAPLSLDVTASIGMNDVDCFMPDLAVYTSAIPRATPLNARLRASGELGDADIPQFDIALPGILSLRAKGHARNALDVKKMLAELDFDGELRRPDIVSRFAEIDDMNIPALSIKGKAKAANENYSADFRLMTPHGSVAAAGAAGMNSERYMVDVNVRDLDVGAFTGDSVIGVVSASLSARGKGFNPETPGSHTDLRIDLTRGEFNGHKLRDISMAATLADGGFSLNANSNSPILDFDIKGNGTIASDLYDVDVIADFRNVDLYALGMSPDKNSGSVKAILRASASPRAWIYDAALTLERLNWQLPDQSFAIGDGVTATLKADAGNTRCKVSARGTDIAFAAPTGLKPLVDGFSQVATMIPEVLERKNIDVAELESKLPAFDLNANIVGTGMVANFLRDSDMAIGDMTMNLHKDSVINGNVALNTLKTTSMRLDTITFNMSSRGEQIDYVAHIGNSPGTLDEFADVNVSGYLGGNSLSAFLTQHDIKKITGYRIGFTASLTDSLLSVRFTPLDAVIAYMPWKLNIDNYVDCSLIDKKLRANLEAASEESSILLKTEPSETGFDALHVNLKNIRVQDFLKMALNVPPVKATVDSDIRVRYTGRALVGKGSLDISDFIFGRKRVGDFSFDFVAGMGNKGKSAGKVGLMINNEEAAAMQFVLAPDSTDINKGLIAERLRLSLTKFPLSVANPFFPPGSMSFAGALSGDMSVSGKLAEPKLNGSITGDSLSVFVGMLGTDLRFGNAPVTVEDNVLRFGNYDIYAVNSNPLTINGCVDASSLSNITIDLNANAKNMQLTGQKGKRGKSDISGNLFVDLGASVRGSMKMIDINANLNVLPKTDVTYNMEMLSNALGQGSGADDVVKFVNFADTTLVAKTDSLKSMLGMRISAKAVISQGAQVTLNLLGSTETGSGKVECSPSGTLNYSQNYMGDMKLNGTLYTGDGYARYNVPLLGTKNFDFDRTSHITWNGDILNPILDIRATDNLKTNIRMNGNSRMVNFLVTLNVTNTLSAPSVQFDLSTDDDVSISNELQSMTADQRQQQAMNMMLTGMYTGPSAKSVNSNVLQGNLYGFLTSQLNSLASRAIKGVDINFGVDQYETGSNGNTSTNMSYSYQVSKSLINNRFKILVGGNYSTDASADENFEQNLISDIAFEYILKQTNNMTLNARLFRHTGFESVLEGEITETGVGLSLRRRLAYFSEITHFGLSKLWKKPKKIAVTDSAGVSPALEGKEVVNEH